MDDWDVKVTVFTCCYQNLYHFQCVFIEKPWKVFKINSGFLEMTAGFFQTTLNSFLKF